ncbi:YCF48-related protein [Pelomonas sp. KK5]|uniref:YCF48-related protein n=1 Tax=Pelomonas sp. KK5 TaxID=1855730 RepID=UPI0009FA95AA|nr:YCF48-related protein [Pelomonas sp. KK5]
MHRLFESFGRSHAIGLLAAAALSACGGGSDSPAPTAIPASLAVSAPASAEVAGTTPFSSNASALSGLKYSWDFGDGSSSTEAAPSHSYAQGGDYTVTLRVTNEAGISGEVRYSLSVANKALVSGLACSGATQSGWCWEQPSPSGNQRYDSFFVDGSTGWSVGANGTILKTADGGAHWTPQSSGVDIALRSVRFADASNGWIQGDYGALLHTTDGGTTWAVSELPGNVLNASLQVLDARTLFVKAGSGQLVSSTDAGLTWQTPNFTPTVDSATRTQWSLSDGVLSRSVDFGASKSIVLDARPASNASYYYSNYQLQRMDDQHLLVVRASQGYVNGNWVNDYAYWRTQDGGLTWDTPAMLGLPANGGGSSLSFVSAMPGLLLALSNNTLYRSTDVGGSWSAVVMPTGFPYSYFYGVTFYPLTNSLVMAYSYYGAYTLSRDGGQTWTTLVAPGSSNGYASYNTPQRVQWLNAAGAIQLSYADGSIYRSADYGQTWTQTLGASSVPSDSQLGAFWALDTQRAVAIDRSGHLLASSDGGRSWAVKQSGLYSNYYGTTRIVFNTAKIGWLYLGDGRLYRTTDGGDTWLTGLNSNFYSANFQFLDERTGFAVNGSKLSKTADGGVSWIDLDAALPMGTTKVAFQSATHGLAYGSNGIAETSDGGQTWTPRYTGSTTTFYAAQYIDAKTAWALGSNGDMQKSVDGGTTWQRVSLPVSPFAPAAMQFLDAQHGWVVGYGGAIVATSDGGKTWVRQASGSSSSLQQVQFVDSKTGWTLGSDGALLVTGTGGN